jgi:hypothetical protein
VIVAKPTTPTAARAGLDRLREGIDALVAARKAAGARVTVIDARGAQNDGQRLSPEGLVTLADRWFSALEGIAREPA